MYMYYILSGWCQVSHALLLEEYAYNLSAALGGEAGPLLCYPDITEYGDTRDPATTRRNSV